MVNKEQYNKGHIQTGKFPVNSETCGGCHGSGMIKGNTCSSCNGTGII